MVRVGKRIWLVVSLGVLGAAASADDWPQFLGPDRNGTSRETGLIDEWPGGGPQIAWRRAVGSGMSGVSVAGEMLVTVGQDESHQSAIALSSDSGRILWRTPLSAAYRNSMGDGPRATPALAGNAVAIFTGEGTLAVLERSSGKVRWRHNLIEEFHGRPADYGMACSPLIAGEQVIVTVGASEASVVAYHLETGELIWRAGSDRAGYSSPAIKQLNDRSQLLVFTGESLLGIDAQDGKQLWKYGFETDFDCNIATPLLIDGRVFISAGENHGSTMLAVSGQRDPMLVEEIWSSPGRASVLRSEWQTPCLWNGKLYGMDNVGSAGPVTHLVCIDPANGQLQWRKARFGKGNLIAADGKLFISTMAGELVVARADAVRYEELGRMAVVDSTRQAPVLANGRIYMRGSAEVVAIDVGVPR